MPPGLTDVILVEHVDHGRTPPMKVPAVAKIERYPGSDESVAVSGRVHRKEPRHERLVGSEQRVREKQTVGVHDLVDVALEAEYVRGGDLLPSPDERHEAEQLVQLRRDFLEDLVPPCHDRLVRVLIRVKAAGISGHDQTDAQQGQRHQGGNCQLGDLKAVPLASHRLAFLSLLRRYAVPSDLEQVVERAAGGASEYGDCRLARRQQAAVGPEQHSVDRVTMPA